MLDRYSLIMPKCIYSGKKALENIKGIIEKEDVRRISVFTDKTIEKTGLLETPLTLIEETGADYQILNEIPAEPEYTEVQNVVNKCRKYGADFIIAIGGGSVMDTAKLASISIGGDYSIKELLDDPEQAQKFVKTLMIPTTAGTGSEATPNAIVAVSEKELKIGIVNINMIADYVILDAAMIKNLPAKIAASTGVDALAHAIECFTSNKANPLSDIFAMEALYLIINNIERACNNPDDMISKNKMQLASFYAGVAITASGTTAVHALSYPLGGKYHIAHGVSNAMLLVPVMKFNEPEIRTLLVKVYDRCFETGNFSEDKVKSKAVIERLSDIVKNLGIPTSLKEFGVSEKDLDSLVTAGLSVTRLLNNNAKEVTADDAKKIYMEIL